VNTVLQIVAPIFAIVALGWAARRSGRLSVDGERAINGFVFGVCTPALLFAGGATGAALRGGTVAIAFFGAVVLLFAAATLLAARGFRESLPAASLFALNCTFGNSVMMGVPLIFAAFGEAGLALLLAIIGLHSLILLPLATVVAELGLHARASLLRVARATLLSLARNPVTMSVVLALLWALTGLPLPQVVRRTLELLGAAGPPAALFCLGSSLAGFGLAGAWREVIAATTAKLLLLPALVWAGALALGLAPLETAVAVCVAALPTGANAFMLARRYEVEAERAGATVLVSSLLSVVTLGALLVHFRAG
jgi:hypothetical protein